MSRESLRDCKMLKIDKVSTAENVTRLGGTDANSPERLANSSPPSPEIQGPLAELKHLEHKTK